MRFLKENWKLECIVFCIHETWTGKYVIRNCFSLSFNKETSSTKFLLMTQMEIVHFLSKVLTFKCLNLFCFPFLHPFIFKFLPFIALFFSLCLCVTLSKSVFQSFSSFNETLCSSLLVFGSCCLSSLLSYAVSWLSSAFTAL